PSARGAAKVGDLHLPAAGVDELPCRREEDRLRALAITLPDDAHALHLDEPLLVRVARPRLLPSRGSDDHGSDSRNSRMSRFTFTGSRICGACPDPSSKTSSPLSCSAKAVPRVWDVIASWSPWITSPGQRTRRQSACASSGLRSGASMVAIITWASVSSPQPTASSIGFVECGSVNIFEMKNSTQSR